MKQKPAKQPNSRAWVIPALVATVGGWIGFTRIPRHLFQNAGTGTVGSWFRDSLEPWVLLIVVLGCAAFLAEWWVRRFRAPEDSVFCRKCSYDLSGLPRTGVCPECGERYRRSDR
jgi:hypothetical protein